MSEYKRLSDRAIDIINELHTERLDYDTEYVPLIDAALRLSDLEDKIESGRLVDLPCKVGDTVWVINTWMEYGDRTKGEPYFVTRYELVEGKATGVEIYGSDYRIMQNTPSRHGVQPYVFTSKAKAETRLKELKGEQ